MNTPQQNSDFTRPVRVMFLYALPGPIVTGGYKYEDMIFEILRSDSRFEVDRRFLGNKRNFAGKYFSWIPNLKLLGELSRYDIVIFNSVEGLNFTPLALALRMRGVRTAVVHHHFLYLSAPDRAHAIFYRAVEMGFLRACKSVIIPSPYILDLCRKCLNHDKLIYWQIPFAPHPVEGLDPRRGNLLYIGTIEQRKGLDLLIEAMTMLKERGVSVRLTVVGKTVDEEFRRRLDERIRNASLDVTFTGFVSAEEKDEIVRHSDIFTFPSRHEGYGMAICESLVNGLPVVCFDNSAMPYTVKDQENGLVVPDGDAAAMAAAIERIVLDRNLRSRLSRGALNSAGRLMNPDAFRHLVTATLYQRGERRAERGEGIGDRG